MFEATLGLCRRRHANVAEVREDVADSLAAAVIRAGPITSPEADAAPDVFARYGEGRGHPARLDLRDCFAYAVAKTLGTTPLFEGDDFDRTDIHSATDARGP